MDLLADLTASQRDAVTHVKGPLLILAAAGSGKTRVITRRVAYLMSQADVAGKNILALTFTNKAAGEMRTRIEAIAPGSGVWVGTFHSLCARLLRTYAPLVGLDRSFTIYDQADRLRAVKQAIAQLQFNDSSITPERVDAIISRAKNNLLDHVALGKKIDGDHLTTVSAQVYKLYQERLKESSAVDFDDLLVHFVTILKEHKDVRADLDKRFQYVLVDEYQDTNIAQYAIVRALSVDYPNICVTGDPDQSIYGWRGANLNNILEFEHDYPGTKVVKLERNYRSTKNILKVADGLIRHNRKRKPKGLTTENATGSPVVLTIYSTELDEANGVASKIVEAVREGTRTFGEIAVFCRVTALTRNLEGAFRAAKIPYQVVGGVSYYERQEVKDVLAYLGLAVNPKDDIAFGRIVNVPPRGIGETTLEKLTEYARSSGLPLLAAARQYASVPGLKERAASALRDFCFLMDELTAIRDHTAEEVIERLLRLSGYHAFLESDAPGKSEDRLANVQELSSAAHRFDESNPGASIVEFMEQISLASAVDRMSDEGGAVTLMTLHAAKGLEFPLVFIIGIEQGLLPHVRVRESESEMEEERRLFFVGITRAERELRLSHCRIREFRGQRTATIPSKFLSELPVDLLDIHDLSAMSSQGSFTGIIPSRNPSQPAFNTSPKSGKPGFHLTTASALKGGSSTWSNSSTSASVGDSTDAFRPGSRVLHPEFGLGRIVSIEGEGARRKGKVAFAVGGERTFILAQSPLKPLGGG